MKRMQIWITACQLEQKWRRIWRNRRQMAKLLADGEAYTSPRLVELEELTIALGLSYGELEKRYRALAENASADTSASGTQTVAAE